MLTLIENIVMVLYIDVELSNTYRAESLIVNISLVNGCNKNVIKTK